MKRLFKIILLIYFILKLITSCTAKEIFGGGVGINPKSLQYDKKGARLPFKITPFNQDILPPSSGVQFYKEGIVFPSLSKNEGKMMTNHLSFGTVQAFYAAIKDTILGPLQIFSPSVYFPYPCEALTFSNDFNDMYFTKISETDNREKIFHAKFVSSPIGWKIDTEPLSFCKEGFSYTNPSVSIDESMMIFASNNSESSGGMDLFITTREGEKWTGPKNIGVKINTKGNELFPFLDTDNNLFFSSDGRAGFGGYDIFVSKFNGKEWEIPVNLTIHINSSGDDIAFTINNTVKNMGFFTVRQKLRSDEMQLYLIDLNADSLISDSQILSNVLYSLALSEIDSLELRKNIAKLEATKLKSDSIEKTRLNEKNIEAERIKAARLKADSLEAAELIRAKINADSIETARLISERLEAERVKAARLKADSLEAAGNMDLKTGSSDVVIYKVQIISTLDPRGNFETTINGIKYTAYEYLYLGEYRYTIGEFSTLKPASELQNICRKSGYSQAFVAAFKNNIRSTDPTLFK